MAEQFLSKLSDIEKKIESLDDTLKRMVTVLGTMTEIRSDIRLSKEEILDAIKAAPRGTAEGGMSPDAIVDLVKGQFDQIGRFLGDALTGMQEEILAAFGEIQALGFAPAAAPAAPETSAPVTTPTTSVSAPQPVAPEPEIVVTPAEPAPTVISIPADKAMNIADEIERIIASMKMGCKAGDVIDQMEESKEAIFKIVPSDPIMVKLDKWKGVVASYPKRKELQARDILKLKKEMRAEIPKYRPA
ncbi:MAG: hypothetical protein ACFE7R_04095 [Candidatus Hodarchaeota archaeon]